MKHTKLAAALLSATFLLSACGGVDEGPVVMTVGNIEITQSEFEFFLDTYKEQLDFGAAKKISQEYCEKNNMVLAVAKAMGVEMSDEVKKEFDDYFKQVKESYDEYENENGKKGFSAFLKEKNLTEDYISSLVSVSFYAEILNEKLGESEYTDEEKQEYFKNHYRRAKHILISTTDMNTGASLDDEQKAEATKKAEELLNRAKSGENFDSLISEFSEDPGSATNPDGYVFTDNEMVIEFQDGVDSIKPGEFTLVESDYGYHVIQRLALDETPEYFKTEYDKVSADLDSIMDSTRFEEQLVAWAEEYGVKTVINEEEMNKIEE